MLSLRLPETLESRLTQLAEKTGRTKSFYAKEAIARYLDEMEDAYIALDRLKQPAERITLDEVEKQLELDK